MATTTSSYLIRCQGFGQIRGNQFFLRDPPSALTEISRRECLLVDTNETGQRTDCHKLAADQSLGHLERERERESERERERDLGTSSQNKGSYKLIIKLKPQKLCMLEINL